MRRKRVALASLDNKKQERAIKRLKLNDAVSYLEQYSDFDQPNVKIVKEKLVKRIEQILSEQKPRSRSRSLTTLEKSLDSFDQTSKSKLKEVVERVSPPTSRKGSEAASDTESINSSSSEYEPSSEKIEEKNLSSIQKFQKHSQLMHETYKMFSEIQLSQCRHYLADKLDLVGIPEDQLYFSDINKLLSVTKNSLAAAESLELYDDIEPLEKIIENIEKYEQKAVQYQEKSMEHLFNAQTANNIENHTDGNKFYINRQMTMIEDDFKKFNANEDKIADIDSRANDALYAKSRMNLGYLKPNTVLPALEKHESQIDSMMDGLQKPENTKAQDAKPQDAKPQDKKPLSWMGTKAPEKSAEKTQEQEQSSRLTMGGHRSNN